MYVFESKSTPSTKFCLRPENTAGIVRCLLSNKLTSNLPQKWFYHGPMFRYERPQKGRYRQFHQFGVENIGSGHYHSDVEIIALANDILQSLNISQVTLEINSLGDLNDRKTYRQVLKNYLEKNFEGLSKISKNKFERGSVLRILDSKEKEDLKIIEDAPKLINYLSNESIKHFIGVLEGLKWLNIKYKFSPHLVRGLDYYSHTTFEFKMNDDSIGSKDTVLGGGRYDNLVEQMGGPKTPAIGWACGIERLSFLVKDELIKKEDNIISIIVHRMNDPSPNIPDNVIENITNISNLELTTNKEIREAIILCHQLRQEGFTVLYQETGNLKKQLQKANQRGSKIAIIIGSDELQNECVTVKDLTSGVQQTIPKSTLKDHLNKLI